MMMTESFQQQGTPGHITGGQETAEEDDALLQTLQTLHLTHREAVRLFVTAARKGATDDQIAAALRQGLPHLDPDCFQQGMHAEQKKRTCTTDQATKTQPSSLAADAFATVLSAVPSLDWNRTWAADRTIMLRMTSKRVKDIMDRVRLPAVVRIRRSFLNEEGCGKVSKRLKQIFAQLVLLVDRCRITAIELSGCQIKGKFVESLAGVLAHCPELARLVLSSNEIGPDGAERLAGVLGQCTALSHLDLSDTSLRGFSIDSAISSDGAGRLAEVLPRCLSLSHLYLSNNGIGLDDGPGRLARVLPQCRALVHLDLSCNYLEDEGTEILAGVLAQLPALATLDLSDNHIAEEGAERLAEVLPQCPALARLIFRENDLGVGGAGSLAGALARCRTLVLSLLALL
jgi:Leucine-rich repeat (LRR) protein